VVSKIVKKRLVLNEEALKAIRARFASRGREYVNANDRQALIPVGARLIPNSQGTAPGFLINEEGPFIAVLPGVPREMKVMFKEELRRVLEERFGNRIFIRRKILRTCGIFESAVNERSKYYPARSTGYRFDRKGDRCGHPHYSARNQCGPGTNDDRKDGKGNPGKAR